MKVYTTLTICDPVNSVMAIEGIILISYERGKKSEQDISYLFSLLEI